jgi:hypothetical protein
MLVPELVSTPLAVIIGSLMFTSENTDGTAVNVATIVIIAKVDKIVFCLIGNKNFLCDV